MSVAALRREGLEVDYHLAGDIGDFRAALGDGRVDAIVFDADASAVPLGDVLAERLRLTPAVPVIVVSAVGGETASAGADGYAVKTDGAALAAALRRAGESHRRAERAEVGPDWPDAAALLRCLECSPFGTAIFTPAGRCAVVNGRCCEILGRRREELLDMSWSQFTAAGKGTGDEEGFQRLLTGCIDEWTSDRRVARPDGSAADVHIWSACAAGPDGSVEAIVVHLADVTDRKEVERALQRRLEELSRLRAAGEAIGSSLSVEEVIATAVRETCEATDSDVAVLYLRRGDELKLKCLYPSDERFSEVGGGVHRVGQCLCGLAVSQGRSVYSRDIHQDTRCTLTECRRAGIRSFAALPLAGLDGIGGVLAVASLTERDYRQEAAFLETMRGQVAVSLRNATLHERLRRYHEDLRRLASELSVVEERHRRQVASQLHDGIGQSIYTIKAGLYALTRSELDAQQRRTIEEVLAVAEQAMRDMRDLTFDLCPPVLYERGLPEALEWLADRFRRRCGIDCRVETEGAGPADEDIRAMAYMAARELLANVAKHARATRAEVSMSVDAGRLIVRVADDGVGFDAERHAAAGWGGTFGIFSLRQRLELMGGRLTVESAPGRGTTAEFSLPVSSRADYEGDGHDSEGSPGR
ncbi:MAG: GAF domain-containing protein [Planctomycetes bacterium]|nr:GAF domain-containing protein [Planctomycetota bacterium]